MVPSAFTGFPKATLQFLVELSFNNDRQWFEANKSRYERDVREPALEFIRAMAPALRRISTHFVADDRKVGGSLMRVHRDTRFARDKTPYKTNVGIQFRHEVGKDVHGPGFYFHISPEECFLGVGLWHPEADALTRIRRRIDEQQTQWRSVRDNRLFRSHFTLEGESLQRPPKGFDPTHPHLEDLKRKDHIATCSLSVREITSKTVVANTAERFAVAKPYMKFLAAAVDLAF